MSRTSKVITGALVLAAAGAASYYAYKEFSARKAVADQAVGNIQAELDDLDPITRAAVVAKLSSDAAKDYRSKK